MKEFRPTSASFTMSAPVFPAQMRTAAMRAGLRYERAILRKLKLMYPGTKTSPWILYKSPGKSGICQPDALVLLPSNHIILIEIKLSRMAPVRQKLMKFYGPLVQLLYPSCTISYLQIYKNARRGAHKRPVSFFDLENLKPGVYRECQLLA
jgi:hypothetical protein